MRLKTFLSESKIAIIDTFEPVVIAPGKFSIAHLGHKKIVKRLSDEAKKLKIKPILIIIDSGKISSMKPLTGTERKEYFEKHILKDFPDVEIRIAQNAFTALEDLGKDKLYPVAEVVGEDRAGEYGRVSSRVFDNFNEKDFKSITLSRSDSNDKTSWMSSTKIREFIKNDNFAGFVTATGLNGKEAKDWFNLIKGRMET